MPEHLAEAKVHSLLDMQGSNWDIELIDDIFEPADRNQIMICQNILPTADNLIIKKVDVNPLCVLCAKHAESTAHLLMYCDFAKACWKELNVVPFSANLLPQDWFHQSVKMFEPLPSGIIQTVAWRIWSERNNRLWNGLKASHFIVIAEARAFILAWHQVHDVSQMVPRANYIKKLLEDRSLSKVLIGPLFVVFDRTSWNRSMKSWSRVFVDSLFTAFNHNSRSRFVESMSRVFINRSSRSRFAERSSAELVNLPFDSLCVQSLIVNPLLIAFNCSSRSRSVESMSTALVVDSVCVGRLPAIPIPNSAMVSRSQSVNFDVVVSTQPSNIHFNSNSKKASEWPRKGLRRRIGESADLCDRCASVHKEEKFCEIFHLNVSGWRSCESCGKQIHCECILSFHTIVLLNAGGIECIICARKSCILTPNLAWPPPSDFLPLQAEGIKDSRSWNPIAGFGPVPSREVQCLNSPFIGQQLQALVIKSSLILDVLVGCSDLDMYSKMSIKEIADNVFEEMPNRKRHWGMHSVDFYNCWNEYQQESSTQIFILSDKPKDANLILVGFRGTESLDVDDWSFADQDIDGRALMLFLLKHKGSNQINFEIGWPCYCWSKIFAEAKCPTRAVGVPVTLNEDLKNQLVSLTLILSWAYKALHAPAYRGVLEDIYKWEKPPQGWFKINTDVAVDTNSKTTGFGFIVRDCQGDFVAAVCSSWSGILEPKIAKLFPSVRHTQLVET
nr:B3 domain-containing protein Os07g0563300 isoform X1 [Ipomoea batatas]